MSPNYSGSHTFSTLVWYSILVYQIYPRCSNFVTEALLPLLILPFNLPVLFRAYTHPPLFMLYVSCVPSDTSSAFHLYRVSWAALHPHCHTSHSCHAFTVSTSAIQLFLFPILFSLCSHLFTSALCISYAICCMFCHSPVLCFSRASAHPFLFTFHAMHLMCLVPH